MQNNSNLLENKKKASLRVILIMTKIMLICNSMFQTEITYSFHFHMRTAFLENFHGSLYVHYTYSPIACDDRNTLCQLLLLFMLNTCWHALVVNSIHIP